MTTAHHTQLLLVSVIVPFFLFMLFTEYFIAKRKHLLSQIYNSKDSRANIGILLIRILTNALIGGVFVVIFNFVYSFNMGLATHLNPFLYWLILIVGQDFCYYWFHRYSHEIRWGWASHIVHHSSNYLNYTTAIRESVTYLISGVFIFWLPLVYLGFTPKDVLIAIAIGLLYQFYLHTTLIGKLHPVIEYVMNTPSHHRVHHARNPQYINKNYAAIFILWDRWFGSFAKEEETPQYGLVHQMKNYNPFYILFQGWIDMFTLVWKTKKWRYFVFFPHKNEQL